MSQQRKRKNTTLLDFYSKKCRIGLTEDASVDSNVQTAESESACRNKSDEQKVPDSFAEKFLALDPPASSSVLKIVSNDISLCVGKTYANAEKLRCLRNAWTPNPAFNFPFTMIGKRSLRFQYRWLVQFKQLACSQVENGAFCKYCVLFGNKAGAGCGNQPLGALCVTKFCNWKNALERFVDHERSKYHRDSVVKAECTSSVVTGKQDKVAVQLNHSAKQKM